ncbi:hypothetical protein OH76DRAFT_337 [Lentinus brumalis]|uniref:Uncharacterized protein n=1 Tax=Lentinus brumalis TaxID=2498619 RepID=A0A371DWM1_9APHY|nr:hypothetical protein OH76DRAFT_337 [Polyporus brumalis]
MPRPPWDIYHKELMKRDPLGHPMWFPEPCSQFGEVHLGDVGYIIKGEFVFLFNAIERDHPRNIRGVPSDPFDPPPMSEKRQPYSIAPGSELRSFRTNSASLGAEVSSTPTVMSASVGACYEFSTQTGALLRLKEGAHASRLTCEDLMITYMSKHISTWHAFAVGPQVGASIEEDDIVFICGHTKASEWQLAAFHDHSSRGGKLYLHVGVPSLAGGGFHVSFNEEGTATVPSRYGPIPAHSGPDPAPVNHSVFLNYFRMKRKLLFTVPMKAAAGPHQLPPKGDDDSKGLTKVLCDYVFRHSGAELACISERDVVLVQATVPGYSHRPSETSVSMSPQQFEQILSAFRPLIVWNASSGGHQQILLGLTDIMDLTISP